MLKKKKIMQEVNLSIIIIIIGWIVVDRLSARRERKKEWREFARQTASFVDKIEDDALIYHCANSRDQQLEKKIKLDLEELDMRLTLLTKKLGMKLSVSSFRSAITLENFETSTFRKQSYNNNTIQSICYNAAILRQELFLLE